MAYGRLGRRLILGIAHNMNEQTDWDLRLGYLIHDVSRIRRMMFDRSLAPLGITRSQWWVLAFISRKDGLKQTELANELDVGKVALGALIDRLESAGFVTRRPEPIDRRVKRVFLTKKVGQFMKRLRKETDVFNARIIAGIDRSTLEKTSAALLAMKQNLLTMAGDDLPPDSKGELEDTPASRKRKKNGARRGTLTAA
jgi:DNA-binding MarR family transcriptional regulator